MEGYDIFPNGEEYVINAFSEGNTNFSAFHSDSDIRSYIIPYKDDLYDFINQYGECKKNSNEDCIYENIDDGGNIYQLIHFCHGAYLAGIKDYDDKPEYSLGMTVCSGQSELAFSIIFVKYIRDRNNQPYSAEDIIEGTVIHELGHARADLSHLCNGINFNPEHDANFRCIMSNVLPYNDCMENVDILLYGPKFCGRCCDKLKNNSWDYY